MLELDRAEPDIEQVEARDVSRLLHDRVEAAPTDLGSVLVVQALRYRRVDGDQHGRARVHREIGVARVTHVAVHVVAPPDPVGLEEPGDRRGSRDRLGDRHVHPIALAEHHTLGPVEGDRGDEQRPGRTGEAVREPLAWNASRR